MPSDMEKARNVITTMLDTLERSLNTSGQVNGNIVRRKMNMLQHYQEEFEDLFYETELEELEKKAAATEFKEVVDKVFSMRARVEDILVLAAPPTTQRSNFTASPGMEQMLDARELVKLGDAPVSKSEVEVGRDNYEKAYRVVEDVDESMEEPVVHEELENELYEARDGIKEFLEAPEATMSSTSSETISISAASELAAPTIEPVLPTTLSTMTSEGETKNQKESLGYVQHLHFWQNSLVSNEKFSPLVWKFSFSFTFFKFKFKLFNLIDRNINKYHNSNSKQESNRIFH
jgi:hypothetical protein